MRLVPGIPGRASPSPSDTAGAGRPGRAVRGRPGRDVFWRSDDSKPCIGRADDQHAGLITDPAPGSLTQAPVSGQRGWPGAGARPDSHPPSNHVPPFRSLRPGRRPAAPAFPPPPRHPRPPPRHPGRRPGIPPPPPRHPSRRPSIPPRECDFGVHPCTADSHSSPGSPGTGTGSPDRRTQNVGNAGIQGIDHGHRPARRRAGPGQAQRRLGRAPIRSPAYHQADRREAQQRVIPRRAQYMHLSPRSRTRALARIWIW